MTSPSHGSNLTQDPPSTSGWVPGVRIGLWEKWETSITILFRSSLCLLLSFRLPTPPARVLRHSPVPGTARPRGSPGRPLPADTLSAPPVQGGRKV